VVGDEDQSLYRFRGATVRNILEFTNHFENCQQIKLITNYRSHKEIIKRNNRFITSLDWKGYRHPKEIQADPDSKFPDYPAVFSIWGENKDDEAKRFIRLIKFLKEKQIIQDWSDVAILLKSVKPDHSGHYIQALKDSNIPYFAPRAKRYFENDEIKILIACYSIIFSFYGETLNNYLHKNFFDSSIKLLGEHITPALKDYIRRKVKQIENLKEGSLDLTVLDYFYQLIAYEPFPLSLKTRIKYTIFPFLPSLLLFFRITIKFL
jgi:DNA helicase-2/ATP-dependent DNA helicase PcrA